MSLTIRCLLVAASAGVFVLFGAVESRAAVSQPIAAFQENAEWQAVEDRVRLVATARPSRLVTRGYWGDAVTSFEFRADRHNAAILYVQGRYALPLPGNGEWQRVDVRFRAPRFDAGGNKIQNAMELEVSVGAETRRNVVIPTYSEQPQFNWEDAGGPTVIEIGKGAFELRGFRHERADFSEVEPPAKTGATSNEERLVDSVALGKKAFESVGCNACHRVEPDDGSASSGPNLYGLFGFELRTREIVEGGEGHRFQIKASREYLHRSVREPAAQLAVVEDGANRGQAYLPVMPAFAADVVSDEQIAHIGDYLATLNRPLARGPVTRLVKDAPAASYDPMTDSLQWLVGDTVRLQRGPMPGVSARSIHVGTPAGVNYTFDPRILAIAKIWQGGFLDMAGELKNRGGNGLALGYESRELDFGKREYLLAPLDTKGQTIDSSFKEGKFGDLASHRVALLSKADHPDMIAATNAQFLGYFRDSHNPVAAPVFKYRVGENVIEIQTTIGGNGEVEVVVQGVLKRPQVFALNPALLNGVVAETGALSDNTWSIPAGTTRSVLRGRMNVARSAWRPAPTNYAFRRSRVAKEAASAKLPAGYSIENLYPPKDNFGRDQLFEALGLSQSTDGTLVVATRTAGIWRLVNGEWRLFAEGLFDSLGVIAEDRSGLTVVAGQKAELTRISDTNGDGVADKYETLFDAHSYHGNYHSYMHGPVRGKDGAYFIALNLAADGGNSTYNANGKYMGSWGGYSGWAVRIEGVNRYQLFASGLRSPAGVGASPDGRLWFLDNQGEYVGTSKMFALVKDRFYSHPASLIDLPGMTPDSPEIAWAKWIDRREKAVVLFPHNRAANSPGSPAWIPKSSFGGFSGQIVVGDQTQSNLMRVALQEVDGVEQASVIPFFDGLESGVMRPLFLTDGSLLLGQTGRGWQAKGGKVSALQQVRWDGKTIAPQIVAMLATPDGFRFDLTQPLREGTTEGDLRAAISFESWTYRDAPDYGSDELDVHAEDVAAITLSADRKQVFVRLASTVVRNVHPQQTARVYRATLKGASFGKPAQSDLSAYYTLYRFPGK